MGVPSAAQQLAPADLADLVAEPEADILGQGPGAAQQGGGGVVQPAARGRRVCSLGRRHPRAAGAGCAGAGRIGDDLRRALAGRSRLRSTGTVLVRTLQSRISGFTVALVKILQIAPALHGAKMQTTEGTSPVVVWALIEDDDGSRDVVGLSVGGKGDRALVPPDQETFESYSQTG